VQQGGIDLPIMGVPSREDSAFSFGRGMRKQSRAGGGGLEEGADGMEVHRDSAPPCFGLAGWQSQGVWAADARRLQDAPVLQQTSVRGEAEEEVRQDLLMHGPSMQAQRLMYSAATAATAAAESHAATPMEDVAYANDSSSCGYPSSSTRSHSSYHSRRVGVRRQQRTLHELGGNLMPASTSSSSGRGGEEGSSSGEKRHRAGTEGARRRRRVAQEPQGVTRDPAVSGVECTAMLQAHRDYETVPLDEVSHGVSHGVMGGGLHGPGGVVEAMVGRPVHDPEKLLDRAGDGVGAAEPRARGERTGLDVLQGLPGGSAGGGEWEAAPAAGAAGRGASSGLRSGIAGQGAAAGLGGERGTWGGGWLGRRTRSGSMQHQVKGAVTRGSSDGSGACPRLTPGPALRRRRRPPAKTPDARVSCSMSCELLIHALCCVDHVLSGCVV
jgi:hypothetical protein